MLTLLAMLTLLIIDYWSNLGQGWALLKQSWKRELINHLISTMGLRDASASKNYAEIIIVLGMHWEECRGEWRKNFENYCKSIFIYVTWISTGKALKSIWQMKVILLAIAYITSLLPSTHTPGKVKVGVESEREIEKGKFHFENKSVTVSGALMYQWNFSLLQYLLFSPCVTNNGSPPAALPFIKQEREHLDPLQLESSEYKI